MKKVCLILFIICGFAMPRTWAQKIKFPESFHSAPSLFKGMKLAEIPTNIASKYGITKNPCLITDVAKARGALFSARTTGVKAIYLEIWEDPMIKKSDCGYEVAQFESKEELEKALPKFKSWSYGALLTVQNYLIVIKCVPSKNAEEKIDKLIAYFQKKLGAHLFLDRLKEVEVAVTENYVTNLPPPLPPGPKGEVTQLEIGDLEKSIANTDGLAYMRTKNRKKLAPGKYMATSTKPAFETISFTIDNDSLLNGDYLYHYAEDYSKSPSKESKLTYDNGVLLAETVYKDSKLAGSSTSSALVVRDGKDYLITLKTNARNPNGGDKEVVTVFRNKKPISKITTRLGVSIVRKDFERNYLDEFNKGQLVRLEKPNLIEKYSKDGKVTDREEWIDDVHLVSKNGKLIKKEIKVKGKDQYAVTDYDENGKVLKEWFRGIETYAVVANPDEYESDLTEALFNYYKKKVK